MLHEDLRAKIKEYVLKTRSMPNVIIMHPYTLMELRHESGVFDMVTIDANGVKRYRGIRVVSTPLFKEKTFFVDRI